jgi:hypothetical protein
VRASAFAEARGMGTGDVCVDIGVGVGSALDTLTRVLKGDVSCPCVGPSKGDNALSPGLSGNGRLKILLLAFPSPFGYIFPLGLGVGLRLLPLL